MQYSAQINTVSIVGAGNVGTHLATILSKKGISIKHVYSPNLSESSELARRVGAEVVENLQDIQEHADCYVIATPDNAIASVFSILKRFPALLVHTSGSVGLEVFAGFEGECGVFYPLQTFSKEKELNFSDIPILIEAHSASVYEKIENLAKLLSNTVLEVDSEMRAKIHLAAVFACNFSNHMLVIADAILKEINLDRSVFMPLMKETLMKAMEMDPVLAQTGPAVRGDKQILDSHLEELQHKPKEQELYKLISESILRYNSEHEQK